MSSFFIFKILFKTYVIEQILQEGTLEKRQTKEQENLYVFNNETANITTDKDTDMENIIIWEKFCKGWNRDE